MNTLLLPRVDVAALARKADLANGRANHTMRSDLNRRCPDRADTAPCEWPIDRIVSTDPGMLPGNDVIVLGFCHLAQVVMQKARFARRRVIRCHSVREAPYANVTPPLPSRVDNIGAFNTLVSHWQHGIIHTLPILGMAGAAMAVPMSP